VPTVRRDARTSRGPGCWAQDSPSTCLRKLLKLQPFSPNSHHPNRVLIVEDEFLIAMTAEDSLCDAGIEVIGVAATCEEAIALAEQMPDLVLMDIRLASARDGIEAAIEIRRRFGIPSLFTSANHDDATMNRAEPAEPQGWLPKPYSPEALVCATRAALEKSGRP